MGRGKDIIKLFVVSVGMITDAYEVFLMNIVTLILGEVYGTTSYSSSLTSTTVLVGMALGQLVFGYLGDKIGRKYMFIVTAIFLIFFSIVSALIFPIIFEEPYIALSIIRFFLGLGIGGEYPLSSTITAETSTAKSRSKKMVIIFTMRGIGNMLAPIVVLILLYTPLDLDYVWRIAFALGALPCLLTLYWRFTLDFPNKVREKKQKINYKRVIKTNWLALLGTAGTWLLFDIAFYGNSMCNSNILKIIGFAGKEATDDQGKRDNIITNCIGNIILTVVGFPGFIAAYFVIDCFAKKYIQVFGFAGTTLTYVIIAIWGQKICDKLPYLYVFIYGLSFFFQNLGPNTMTYILSAEVYTKKIRSTMSGISAASGKVGAMIGTAIFDPFTNAFGVSATFGTCAAMMVVGLGLTFCIPNKSAVDEDEDNEGESQILTADELKTEKQSEESTPAYAYSPASPAAGLLSPAPTDVERIFAPIMDNISQPIATQDKGAINEHGNNENENDAQPTIQAAVIEDNQ